MEEAMLMLTTKEFYKLVHDLATKFSTVGESELNAVGGTQGFLCSEGITGDYILTNISPDDMIRAHVANMWNGNDGYIQQIIDFIMHIYATERNYLEERDDTVYDPIHDNGIALN